MLLGHRALFIDLFIIADICHHLSTSGIHRRKKQHRLNCMTRNMSNEMRRLDMKCWPSSGNYVNVVLAINCEQCRTLYKIERI